MGERFEVTPKQAAFVDEYLIDLNSSQAAVRAGYNQQSSQRKQPHNQIAGPPHTKPMRVRNGAIAV